MKKIVLCFLLSFWCTAAFAADTLEVFAFLVQFKQEKNDNSLTTGDGTFDSDLKKMEVYSLDPVKKHGAASYWRKHFEFANNYYQAASGGKMAIKARIFPEASSGESVYTLDKQIIDYNRTKKMKGEKAAEYDSARTCDYITFVYDAIRKVHSSKNSPFNIPLSKNPNTKRAFMIIHAGASGLTDGGTMGTNGADTPGDFIDTYVTKEWWQYLPKDSAYVAIAKATEDMEAVKKDSSYVTGIVLKNATIDTLTSMMVVSETASQDGMNWGVNGIIVNQLGREMGMPDTYDRGKGTSRLGLFDVMDFVGYMSAGNGFMPVLPNAWNRYYMGWSKVKEVRPTKGKSISVDVAAAGSGLGTEIVKVPLSASEYLLIENRQRSWGNHDSIGVVLDEPTGDLDTSTTWVLADSIGTVFEDSVCQKGKCKKNSDKAKGVVWSLSSFDAGLPASGIAVWRVNDWFLRETLKYGYANAWLGDTLRDHQFGLSLVEADGILSIGKTFKNALGQDAYDYGSGTDLLPHKRYSKGKKYEVVNSIMPTGYANTKTTQGGYTGIKISVEVPKKAYQDTTVNGFMGDSVIYYSSPIIRVTISIDDGSFENSKFPRNVGLNSAVRGAVFVNNPEKVGEKLVVIGAEDGTMQVFDAMGDTLFEADTALTVETVSNKKLEEKVPLYRIAPSYGPLVGMASDGETVYTAYKKGYAVTKFNTGIPMQDFYKVDGKLTVGPMVVGENVWLAGENKIWRESKWQKISDDFVVQDMAYCGDPSKDGKDAFFALVGENGRLAVAEDNHPSADAKIGFAWRTMDLNLTDKSFSVACTDLDRDGKTEVVVLGSQGSAVAVKASSVGEKNAKAEWKHAYKRGASGTSGLKNETSGIAIGDVNGDAYPEIVFLGDNLVYALDRFGLPIEGFPVKITRGTPVVGFFSDPLIVDVTGDKTPEILVPSSDGIVYAYTGKGKSVDGQFPLAAGSYESVEFYEPMSIFVADAVPSKKSKGPELYALHRSNASAFRLIKASDGAEKSSSAWALPAGGNERTGFFDASKLDKVEKKEAKKEISEFFVYPNPVKGGVAKARFEIGAPAKSATIEFFDITGLCVYKQKVGDVVQGRNQVDRLDLSTLGSDVYTARLKVNFEGGKTKQKLFRVGVVH